MNIKAKKILRKKHSYFTFRTAFPYDKIILAYLQRMLHFSLSVIIQPLKLSVFL